METKHETTWLTSIHYQCGSQIMSGVAENLPSGTKAVPIPITGGMCGEDGLSMLYVVRIP